MSAAGEVARVILVSVSRVQGSVMQQLLAERNRIGARGDEPGVRAALLHSSGWFVLWLEGDEASIAKVVQRYLRDPRHAHQRELHRSRGGATLTEALTLAATQGSETPGDFARRIYGLKKEQDGDASLGPQEIWQRLSAPCTLKQEGAHPPRIGRHFALAASDDPGATDTIRKLAERFSRPVVYQRFASGERHTSDVGAAYVDIGPPHCATRVQVLSRRALGHYMVQQSLAGLQGLVLLLGTRPSAAMELAQNVVAFVEAAAVRPAIHLVTQCPDIGARVGAMLAGPRRADACAVVAMADVRVVDYLRELVESRQECAAQAA